MNKKPLPERIADLPENDMHGPIEVSVKVFMQLASGETGSMSVIAPAGTLPTRAELAQMVADVTDPASLAEAAVPAGTRPQSKTEFVKHISKRDTGLAVTLPGDPQFVAATCEIPHGVLVHAIVGAEAYSETSSDLIEEYVERGLADFIDGELVWVITALYALPDDVLLAVYQRITE